MPTSKPSTQAALLAWMQWRHERTVAEIVAAKPAKTAQ